MRASVQSVGVARDLASGRGGEHAVEGRVEVVERTRGGSTWVRPEEPAARCAPSMLQERTLRTLLAASRGCHDVLFMTSTSAQTKGRTPTQWGGC